VRDGRGRISCSIHRAQPHDRLAAGPHLRCPYFSIQHPFSQVPLTPPLSPTEEPLATPILALQGRDDSPMAGWRRDTTAAFTHRVFPGGHFYLKDPVNEPQVRGGGYSTRVAAGLCPLAVRLSGRHE
jgi:hypothetical protein